tara:strand:+ start:567 stop:725 length:159 start_codon:yes stop_codon:yes gene_type:complete
MKEYEKIKKEQAEQLGSIDDVHPMKQVAIMSVIQMLMLAGVGIAMYMIAISI